MNGLQGTTVYLKTPAQTDVMGYIRHLWADEDSMRDVGGTHQVDEERARRWFAKWIRPGSDDRTYFLVFRREDDVPVGEACFYNLICTTGMAHYSMNIEAKFRGNGYAKEALELLLRFYFEEFGGEVMVDDIAPDNIRAQQMFIKFGFEHHPSLARTITSVGGDDVFWVRMDRERFRELYGRR
ncbi:GNAT family N-acetyltransferase [Alicyclobacillus curvatus]|nr:GNAT family N-acetyltransferase [Alicyclobacillus curvatus]